MTTTEAFDRHGAAATRRSPPNPRPFSGNADAVDGFLALTPAEPVLAAVWRYWADRRGGARCPPRSAIDPLHIPALLPHIGLIDVGGHGQRFRYRLVGTRLNQVFGHDFTGEYLDEAKGGPYGRFLHDLYGEAVRERRPVYVETVFSYRNDRHLTVRRVVLPLADTDDIPVGMLMFANSFRACWTGTQQIPDHESVCAGLPFLATEMAGIRPVERHLL